ncbi:MAG: FAD-dependent thymidylate synthase [Candidatus Nanoarchaeia archaeon]
MVEVRLAGYNIDAEVVEAAKQLILAVQNGDEDILEAVRQGGFIRPEQFSPETVPAAYARISRDPRHLAEIRADARDDVEKAQKSNATIVFDMGHKSVGNHANFNLDVTGISRLAIESLEARRIGTGYTEKSQRYITMEGDYVRPADLSPEDLASFVNLIENVQNAFYARNFETLVEYHFENAGKQYKTGKRNKRLEGLGKEDARFALGLATEGQVGVTFSATALEHAVRILKYSPIAEERDLAQKLYAAAVPIAPSLTWYTDPERFEEQFGRPLEDGNFRDSPQTMKKAAADVFAKLPDRLENPLNVKYSNTVSDVTRIDCNDIDTNVMAAVLFANSKEPLKRCYQAAGHLNANPEKSMQFMQEILQHVTGYDNPPREFEFAEGLKFAVDVSSSCFAQYKRHRMMTLLAQDYDPDLGIIVPDSIKETGLEQELQDVCGQSADLHAKFKERYGKAAEYCLTNAHKRRILVGINPREMNHFSRQRCDGHAQWDIRSRSNAMVWLAREIAPLAHLVTCGKDAFAARHKEIYGK